MKTQEPTSVGGKKCHSVHSLHDGKVSTGSGFMPLCLFFPFLYSSYITIIIIIILRVVVTFS